jgi:hypothetical protein
MPTIDRNLTVRDNWIRHLHKTQPELTAHQLAEKFQLHVEMIYKVLKIKKKQEITVNNPLGNRHPAYKIYKSILDRCYNLRNPRYRKGIQVCSRWRGVNGFVNFYADMGDTDKYVIQRIDETKDYEPENCGWAQIDRI